MKVIGPTLVRNCKQLVSVCSDFLRLHELATKDKVHFRIIGFFDFVCRPVFYKLENATFRKLGPFPPSGKREDIYSVGSLRKNWSNYF
jgi:hypothetical protein